MDVVGERVAGSDISKTDEGVRTGPGRGRVAAFRQEVRTFGAVTRQLQRLVDWLAASTSNSMCSGSTPTPARNTPPAEPATTAAPHAYRRLRELKDSVASERSARVVWQCADIRLTHVALGWAPSRSLQVAVRDLLGKCALR
jgi:hypothetical protein